MFFSEIIEQVGKGHYVLNKENQKIFEVTEASKIKIQFYPENVKICWERIFRKIPGLEKAVFARLGGIHKNTFIKSPILLDDNLRLKSKPHISFAGQITGCEGYVESAATGLLAGYFKTCELQNKQIYFPPETTAIGSVYKHLRDDTNIDDYQPMNVNFGLFPLISGEITPNGKFRKIKGMDRKILYCKRALVDIKSWIEKIRTAWNERWFYLS